MRNLLVPWRKFMIQLYRWINGCKEVSAPARFLSDLPPKCQVAGLSQGRLIGRNHQFVNNEMVVFRGLDESHENIEARSVPNSNGKLLTDTRTSLICPNQARSASFPYDKFNI